MRASRLLLTDKSWILIVHDTVVSYYWCILEKKIITKKKNIAVGYNQQFWTMFVHWLLQASLRCLCASIHSPQSWRKRTQINCRSCWSITLLSLWKRYVSATKAGRVTVECSGSTLRRSRALTGRSCTRCSIPSLFSVNVWRRPRAQSAWAPITSSQSVPWQLWSRRHSRTRFVAIQQRLLGSQGRPGKNFNVALPLQALAPVQQNRFLLL